MNLKKIFMNEYNWQYQIIKICYFLFPLIAHKCVHIYVYIYPHIKAFTFKSSFSSAY